MDVQMLVETSVLEQQEEYPILRDYISRQSRACHNQIASDSALQTLRDDYSAASVCPAPAPLPAATTPPVEAGLLRRTPAPRSEGAQGAAH